MPLELFLNVGMDRRGLSKRLFILLNMHKGVVTNYGEGVYKTGGVGGVKFYPYKKKREEQKTF